MRNATFLGVLVACSLFASNGQPSYGAAGTADSRSLWPTASELPRAEGKATVIAFVQAGDERGASRVAALTAATRKLATRPFVEVVYVSAPVPAAWNAGAGLARLVDREGAEAARFGAKTADHVVVYDAAGALRYAGVAAGVTAALR
jgi:hypothetical protein